MDRYRNCFAASPSPPPQYIPQYAYSGKVSLRFSPFTHEEASNNAKALNISLNQYINDAIVYYNALNKNKINYSGNYLNQKAASIYLESEKEVTDKTFFIKYMIEVNFNRSSSEIDSSDMAESRPP